ncbi:MAG: carbohydrate ABC transporter permease [Ruminococcus sp.]|nr:carbohydrate ABC transporter permease [Ruminococcus sp.]
MSNKKLKRKISRIFLYAAVVMVCFIAVFPYLWMVLVSLKERVLVYQPEVLVFKPVLENYVNVFKTRDLGSYLINSAVIASLNCIISLALGSFTAYALARYEFRGREKCALFLTFIRILPAVASVIPIYVIAAAMKILDTHGILITVYLLFNVPFTVLMMRGFFEEIPVELEEAAKVDGCTSLQALRKIVLPLAKPGLVATAIFCVINSWNEFLYAMLLTTYKASTTPTIVQMFKTISGVIWGEMSAVGTVATLPVLIFAMLVQKHMVRGLSFGAVKG